MTKHILIKNVIKKQKEPKKVPFALWGFKKL
jgi:hypothetical protein